MAAIHHLISLNPNPPFMDILSRLVVNRSNDDPCPPGKEAPYPPHESPEFLENIPYPFERTLPTWEVALKSVFYAVPMAMATIGNALVLITIVFHKKLHAPTYVYIANLAVSDFVVGAFNMWMHLVPSIFVNWPLGSGLCEISIFIRS